MGEISMATHWDQMNRLLLVFFLTICFATSAKATEGGLPSVAGTYEILICRGLCASSDSINVEVRGHVVLLDTPLERQTVHNLDDSYYPVRWHEKPNGCYELSRADRNYYTAYAGITPFGVTAWSQEDGAVTFSLYHSVDSGYDAIVKPTPDGLFGKGVSWGAGITAPTKQVIQTIVARRVGDADVQLCQQWAARARKTELEATHQ